MTSLTFKWRWCTRRKMRRKRRRMNWVHFSLSDAILIWLSLTAKFLNNEEEEEDDEDWHCPMSPRPSDDEAAKLRASAAARRVAHSPMPKVPKSIPWHFLLPAQGDPDIWAAHVKVWQITHDLYESLSFVAQPWGSPHISTHLLLYHSQWWYLSPTHNRIGVFLPWDPRIYIHQRLTMWHCGCCPQPGNCILTAITGPTRRTLDFTFNM